ncbi:MAG: hypothetical protein ABNH00_09870 [Dokdonia sp.]|jgi:hypothetical protein
MKKRIILLLCAISLIGLSGCDNEDVDDLFTATNTADLIAEDSELFTLLERATSDDDASALKPITCIRFIYSFTVVIYLENSELERSQIVNNDAEFSALLGEVGEGQFVGVSFPITSQLEDGSTFEVNNKEELKAAIDACVIEEQEGIIGECEGLLQSCVWEVQLPAGTTDYDTYENAVFDVSEDGTVDFYHRGVRYDGTWIVYFIEDELHININLDDDNPDDDYMTDLDWNFDWKTVIVDAQTMNISIDDGKDYVLKQRCETDAYCTTFTFAECEMQDNPGFAEFLLDNYISCIATMGAPEPLEDEATESDAAIEFTYSFYLSEADASNAVNPINGALAYVNTTNPQIIVVRIDHPDTQEFWLIEIELVAQDCQ